MLVPTEGLRRKLRSFHHRCIRTMCSVTRWHVRFHRIRNTELRCRLEMETIDYYVLPPSTAAVGRSRRAIRA